MDSTPCHVRTVHRPLSIALTRAHIWAADHGFRVLTESCGELVLEQIPPVRDGRPGKSTCRLCISCRQAGEDTHMELAEEPDSPQPPPAAELDLIADALWGFVESVPHAALKPSSSTRAPTS